MQDRPDPVELIRTVAGTLRDKLMPQLAGSAAFEARVAANALDLVVRQLTLAGPGEAAELARLQALLGTAGSLADLNHMLCERIASGAIAADDVALRDHLWATTLDKLAVDQPTYAAYRAEVSKS
ncbi:MAG: DUF6285 domain-containing protein [Pseudomonadota bacterium]